MTLITIALLSPSFPRDSRDYLAQPQEISTTELKDRETAA